MRTKTTWIIFLLVLHNHLISQYMLKGHVFDLSTNSPIARAIVSYRDTISNKVLSFSWTDETGSFELTVENLNVGRLETTALGFNFEFTRQLESGDYEIFMLSVNDSINQVIENIEIKAKKEYFGQHVVASYDAMEYRDSLNDRLEDLISNIPGIVIDRSDGKIFYYNNMITDVLLDGDNLMSGDYTSLTQNVSQDIAKGVDIIQGYTQNIVLNAMNSRQEYALNIHVDSTYRNRVSGNLKIGMNNQYDFLSDTDLLGISRQTKLFLTADRRKGYTGFAGRTIISPEFIGRDLLLTNSGVSAFTKLTPFGRVNNQVYNPNFGVLNNAEINRLSVNGLSKLNVNHRIHYNVSAVNFNNTFDQNTTILPLDRSLPDYFNRLTGKSRLESLFGSLSYSGLIGRRVQISSYLDWSNKKVSDALNGEVNNLAFDRPLQNENPMITHGYQLATRIGDNQGMIVSSKYIATSLDMGLNYTVNSKIPYPISIMGETVLTDRAHYAHLTQLKQHEYNFNYAIKVSPRIIVKAMALYKDIDILNETNLLISESYPSTTKLDVSSFENGVHLSYVNRDFLFNLGVSNAFISLGQKAERKNIWLYNGNVHKNWSLYNFQLSAIRTASFVNPSVISAIPFVKDEIHFSFNNFENLPMYLQAINAISLAREFPKNKQELSVRVEYKREELPFVYSYYPEQDRIVQFIRNEPSTRSNVLSALNYEVYWPRLRQRTRFIFNHSFRRIQDMQNDISRDIFLNETGLTINLKSFFASQLNYSIDIVASSIYSKVNATHDNFIFYNYSVLGTLNYKVNNRVKIKYTMDMNNYNGSNLFFASMDLGYTELLNKLNVNLQIHNVFNTSLSGLRSFNQGYSLNTIQNIQSRQFTIFLSYRL